MNKKIIIIMLGILVLLAGSLFILKTEGVLNSELLPNNLFGTISAVGEESNPEVTITRSTETTCNNGKCNLILYSGIRFVEEDNQWKKVEDARSLKDKGFNVVFVKDDGTHKIEVVDFNMTYIELNFSYDKDNLGEFELEIEDGKMKTKFKIIETLFNETTGLPYDVETEIEIEIEEDAQSNIILNGNPFGKEFKLGENSTTIILQDADTENLGDTMVEDGDVTNRGSSNFMNVGWTPGGKERRDYLKFNISSVPSEVSIDEATLYLFKHTSFSKNDYIFFVHHVLNQTWDELEIVWASQPCGTAFDNSSLCNLTSEDSFTASGTNSVWYNLTIINMFDKSYNDGDENISIVLKSEGFISAGLTYFRTKEWTTASERPYLNITYSPAEVTVNLDNPVNNTFSNVLNQIFNASYDSTAGDLVNATLNIWNSTPSLVYNETDSVTGSSNSSSINFTFSVDDVYVWNYEVCDDSVLCGSNSTNFTITIDTTPPTFDNLANQDADANTTFTFDIDATDVTSSVSCFTVNDTTNFQIDCDGVLQNNTVLSVQVYPLNISVNDSANNTAYGTMDVNVTVFDTILKWDWAALMTDLISPDQICFIFRGSEEYCIDSSTITGKWSVSGSNLFPSDLSNNVGINTTVPNNTLSVSGTFNVSGNASFQDDVIIDGTIFGGSPVKISGGLNVTGDVNTTGLYYGNGSQLDISTGDLTPDGTYILATGDTATGNYSFDSGTLFINANDNRIGIGTTSPAEALDLSGGNLLTTATITAGTLIANSNLQIAGTIEHIGDVDTEMKFGDDQINLTAGNIPFISIIQAAQNILVLNENSFDVDFRIESDADTHAFFLRGSDGNIGIGTATPQNTLNVLGDANITADLISQTIYYVSSQGLVLAMNFNNGSVTGNTVLDSSRENNHGTNNGATHNATGGFDDLGSGAFDFDGVDDFIEIPDSNSLDITDEITIALWINADTFGSFERIVDKKVAQWTFVLTDSSPFTGLEFWINDGVRATTSTGELTADTWHFVVATYDKDLGGTEEVKIYIDGVSKATGDFSTAIGTNNHSVDIGRETDGEAGKYFDGTIDEVFLWNRALSSDEIKRLYLQRAEFYDSYVSQKDVYVDSSGNVGINTTTPQNLLNVLGDANITGNLYGILGWTNLTNYPSVCSASQYISALGDTLTCASISITESQINNLIHSDATWVTNWTDYNSSWSSTTNSSYMLNTGDTGTGNFIFNQNFTIDTDTFFLDSNSDVIGIGTVNPASQLHIYVDNADTVESFLIEQDGAGDATMQLLLTGGQSYGIGIDSDDGNAFKIDNNGPDFASAEFQIQANNDVILVRTGGNVGIGTTSPDEGVEIANGALLLTGRNSSSGIVLHLNSANPPLMHFSDDGILRGKISTGSNIITGASPTGLGIYSADALAFSTNSDGVMRMIIDNSGNVGIGTAGPNATLEVINSTTQGGFMVSSSSSGAGDLFIVDENGRVGIGTSSPDGKLSIQNVGGSDTVNLLTFSENEAAEFYFESGFSGSGSTGNFLKLNTFWTNNTMVWRGDGNVGIGTSSPSVLLEVSDATNPTFLVTDTTNTVSVGLQATDTLGVVGTSTNHALTFETNNVEWMRISNSGKIGIRTTNSNIDLAFGDSDTGFNQSADGILDFRSNNARVAGLRSDGRFYIYQVDNSAAENPLCRESSGEITRGSSGCSTSSIRYKQNIQDLNYGLKEIMLLRPITYEYKTDPSRTRFGMTAEEVAKIFPEIIGYEPNDSTLIQTYDKRDVQAVLIKAIQEQQEQINQMKSTLCKLGQLEYC